MTFWVAGITALNYFVDLTIARKTFYHMVPISANTDVRIPYHHSYASCGAIFTVLAILSLIATVGVAMVLEEAK